LRRLLALFVLFAGFGVAAAWAKPLPSPTPVPTATPYIGNAPVILVYPFDEPSDLDPRYGQAIAQIYAQVLNQAGGVTVLAIPSGIKREDYQKFAHVQHADYYVSGFIQPIGAAAAIVSQVVDVQSDISVASATTQIASVQDVGSQALTARSVILEAAGLDREELPTQAAPTPAPAASNGASVPITNVLGDLFKGKSHPKGKVSPTPSPTPPPKPSRGVIVSHLTGNAFAKVLNVGTDALYRAMDAHYRTTMSTIAAANLVSAADSICGMKRNNTIASGQLDVQHVGGFRAHDIYTFTLNIYTCFGAVLYTNKQTNDNSTRAITDAVEAYYTDQPANGGS
jgi:hypothetical protein